ncbi:MAG: hypothetical protein ACRDRX_18280 [Pseudonocardiaceae bacterium]
MTMTTTETFIDVTRRSQEAFMQIWTDGVQRYFELLPAPDAKTPPGVPTPEEVVDHVFDFAATVLATQREYTKSWLAATKAVASSTAWVAQNTTKGATSKKS